jgi:hypothetical protein
MSNGRFGHLWFASIAIIVGGGGLLEHGSKFSLLSTILGVGLGIWFLWVVEVTERHRNRDTKKARDASEAAPR